MFSINGPASTCFSGSQMNGMHSLPEFVCVISRLWSKSVRKASEIWKVPQILQLRDVRFCSSLDGLQLFQLKFCRSKDLHITIKMLIRSFCSHDLIIPSLKAFSCWLSPNSLSVNYHQIALQKLIVWSLKTLNCIYLIGSCWPSTCWIELPSIPKKEKQAEAALI